MNSFDWALIEVFLEVARSGSFTAAAESLGTSQPTVSRQIRLLEEDLGVTLFARHARGFALTDRGEALLESARDIEQRVDTFLRRASGVTTDSRGTVRLSASTPVAVYLLMPFAAEIQESHPGLELEVVAEDRPADLLRLEADIAIRMFQPRHMDLIAKKAADISMGLYASTEYLDLHGRPESINDLKGHRAVGFDRNAKP